MRMGAILHANWSRLLHPRSIAEFASHVPKRELPPYVLVSFFLLYYCVYNCMYQSNLQSRVTVKSRYSRLFLHLIDSRYFSRLKGFGASGGDSFVTGSRFLLAG